MKKVYLELVKQIRDAVRKKAKDIGICEGCIRILAYPCCELADQWLGGLSDFSGPSPDIVDYEHAFPIEFCGSRRAEVVGNNGAKYKIDCYGISALKIAHCSLGQDGGNVLLSGCFCSTPYITETNGYSPKFGALCTEIKFSKIANEKGELCTKKCDFCGIYVSVSSDRDIINPETNLSCASVAIKVIEEFFLDSDWDCDIFEVVAPDPNVYLHCD